ncbi:hypothetical protein EC973_005043 [Apophysomyces ossiformis]|uniref:SHSP domain-containing protein n=1 Tax=Apophysomyces ossiformis TaxID=679940 RepID=A0A8H7BWM1_9FUNG|nr:hypothetical protein EC973_005043 [Apophysomyces ossiformis]
MLYDTLNDINTVFNILDSPSISVCRKATRPRHPTTDIIETNVAYEIHAELPGVDKKDINVEWKDDNTLVVQSKIGSSADASSDVSEEKKPVRRWLTERTTGSFSRSFVFPNKVNQDAITASHKDGLLTIIVPKMEKTTTQIAVQ